MKFSSLFLIATLALYSCMSPDNRYGNQAAVTISISSSGLTTKVMRPLGSSEAANNVNTIELYALREIDGTYVTDTEVVMTGIEDGKISWSSDTEEKTITLQNLKPNSSYRFMAVGYNDYSVYTDPDSPLSHIDGLAESVAVDYTVSLRTYMTVLEELFAGITEPVMTNGKGELISRASVVLTRQVAGILGYFENIPAYIGGEKVRFVRIVANAQYRQFVFPSGGGSLNGVSGTRCQGDSFVVMEFDMRIIAENYPDVQEGNYYVPVAPQDGPATGIVSPGPYPEYYDPVPGLTILEGTIFGACYMIPYGDHHETDTFRIQLCGEDGTPLKTFRASDGTSYNYDIKCNNFYSFGRKPYAGTTDEDKPIDLSGSMDIEVTVHDQWEVVHDMGIIQ